MSTPVVLAIAGSDPSGGAGIQADQRVIEAMGCACVSLPSALTSQNTFGVDSVFAVPVEVLRSQLDTLLSDIRPDAVKIGLLPSSEHISALAETIRKFDLQNVVLDPVIAPTFGQAFLDPIGVQQLHSELMPLCNLITPNLNEAALLAGVAVETRSEIVYAAKIILSRGAQAVLIKGGHLQDNPDDLLASSIGDIWIDGTHIETDDTHGTGCFLSSAIAANLALGNALEDSVRFAKQLITEALKNPVKLGHDRGYPGKDLASIVNDQRLVLKHTHRQKLLHGIYFVTDHRKQSTSTLRETVDAVLRAGVKVIQLRDKLSPIDDLLRLASMLRDDTRRYNALLIINDRVDIALAADADGVHLGPGDMHPRDARHVLGPSRLIGISASSAAEATPQAQWASYIGCGAVYGSKTKGDAGDAIGVERLTEMRVAFSNLPIIAIGGIHSTNIVPVRESGVAGAAVVSAISEALNPQIAAQELVDLWSNNSALANA